MNKLMAWILCCCLVAASSAFAAEYVIDVPEGQVVSNTVALNAETAGDVLVKIGKGTWYKKDSLGGSVNFSKMEVREGTVEMNAGQGLFNPPRIEIRSGATLKQLNGNSYKGKGVVIQVDKGGTFNDFAKAYGNGGGLDVEGEGLYINMHTAKLLSSSFTNFTGDVITGLGTDTELAFGDGADAVNDPDLSHFGSFTMAGGGTGVGNYPRLVFKNKSPMVVTNRFGGLGQMTVNAGSVVTFSNLWKTSGSSAVLSVLGTMTNVNGRLSLCSSANCFNMNDVNARYVQIGGVTYGNWPVTSRKNVPYSRLKFPNGSQMRGSGGSGYGNRILENGAEFWTQYQQPFYTEVNSGSSLVFCGGTLQSSNAKSDEKLELKFDNGTMRLEQDDNATFNVSGPTSVRFVVGAGGMTFATHAQAGGGTDFDVSEGVEITDRGSNGPVSFRGKTTFKFYAPLDIGGTVTIENGTVNVPNKAAYTADGANPPLGRGSLVLDQGRIWSSLPSGSLTRLADASGATVRLTGSSTLHMNSNNTGIDWQIGPADAVATALVREKGSALFFDNSTSGQKDFFKSGTTKGTCVIGGGLPLGTNGKLPVVPIFVQDATSSHSGDSWGGEINFLTYGGSGLVRFDDYATAFGGEATDVVYIGTATNLVADATVAGLNLGNTKAVGIPEGTTLTVGDGTGTACIILNTGSISGVSKKGTGTLDFGAAEGVVTCCRRGSSIAANITGTGGLSVVGSYLSDVNGLGLTLSGNNTYSGGTRISSYRAYAASDTAFGTDDVWALGGEGNGGQIGFNNGAKKVTIANNLHLSGNGQKLGGGGADDSFRMGAVWARSSAELTGTVELCGPTRMVIKGDAVELKISGVISGDSVEFFNHTDSVTNAGTVIYAQANTYTGRTAVVRSTLVLESGATAGMGDIELDGGVLRLVGSATPRVMASLIRGAGTVVLDGPKNTQVTFAAADENDIFLQQEHELDLNGRNRVVNSLKGFTSVKSSSVKQVHLSVLDDAEGSFAGEVAENVTLHYGKVYTTGLTLIVR